MDPDRERAWSFWDVNQNPANPSDSEESGSQASSVNAAMSNPLTIDVGQRQSAGTASVVASTEDGKQTTTSEILTRISDLPDFDNTIDTLKMLSTLLKAIKNFSRRNANFTVGELDDSAVGFSQLTRVAYPYVLADRLVFHIRHVWLNSRHYVLQQEHADILADICDSWYLTDVLKTDTCFDNVELAKKVIPPSLKKATVRSISDTCALPLSAKGQSTAAAVVGLAVTGICCAIIATQMEALIQALLPVAIAVVVVYFLLMLLHSWIQLPEWNIAQALQDFSLLSASQVQPANPELDRAGSDPVWKQFPEGFLAVRVSSKKFLILSAAKLTNDIPFLTVGAHDKVTSCSQGCETILGITNVVGKKAGDVLVSETTQNPSIIRLTAKHRDPPHSVESRLLSLGSIYNLGTRTIVPTVGDHMFMMTRPSQERDGVAMPVFNTMSLESSHAASPRAPTFTVTKIGPAASRSSSNSGKIETSALLSKLRSNKSIASVSTGGSLPSHVPSQVFSILDDAFGSFISHASTLGTASTPLLHCSLINEPIAGGVKIVVAENNKSSLKKSAHTLDVSRESYNIAESIRGHISSKKGVLEVFIPTTEEPTANVRRASFSTSGGRSIAPEGGIHILLVANSNTSVEVVSKSAFDRGHNLQVCKNSDHLLKLTYADVHFDVILWRFDEQPLSSGLVELLVSCCRGSLHIYGMGAAPHHNSTSSGEDDIEYLMAKYDFIQPITAPFVAETVDSIFTKVANQLDGSITVNVQKVTAGGVWSSNNELMFHIRRKVGSGSFGDVYEAELEVSGGVVAVKQIELGDTHSDVRKQLTSIMREVAIMSKITHQNVVRYLSTHRDSQCINILMELCEGSLEDVLKKNSQTPDQIRQWMHGICSAVEYLHDNNIIHRDLKPQNLLFRKDIIKVADFGSATKKFTTKPGTMKGTLAFMAPEILLEQPYGPSCDIWSIGCIFAKLLGIELHRNPDFYTLVSLYRTIPLDAGVAVSSEMPPTLADFLQTCLKRDPKKRATARELLQSPLFSKPQLMIEEYERIPRDVADGGSVCNMSLVSDVY